MGSVDGRLCLRSGLCFVSGEEWTNAMSGCVLVQIGEPVLLLSPRIEKFVHHLRSNGGTVCLEVVKYLVIFQKEGFCGCRVRRKEFHFVFFSCWSLTRKIWVTMWDRYRKIGNLNLWERCR
jgi:hypothetical protein